MGKPGDDGDLLYAIMSGDDDHGDLLFGNKVGFNPFILVRQMEFAANAPIFNRPDYLSIPQMQDGQGLNALLQNYWMVIHPPILFLGFSSTIVPFAFAIAGLWKRQFKTGRVPPCPGRCFPPVCSARVS
jgi:cytochrome c-type biogenesis protein CcmF